MDLFLQAAIPDPFTILGRPLRPFCIGHALLLQRFDCDPVRTLDQLIRAVIICSHRPGEAVAALQAPRWQLRLWAWRLGKFDVEEKIALWGDYLEHSTQAGPETFHDEDEGTPPGAPWFQHLKLTLISKCGHSAAEAIEMPYSLARWDYFTYWENEGRAEILGRYHQDMQAAANNIDPAIVAKLAAQLGNPPPDLKSPPAPA